MNIALISNLGKPPDGKVTPREDREAKNLLISFSVAHNLKTDPFIFCLFVFLSICLFVYFVSYKINFPRLTIVAKGRNTVVSFYCWFYIKTWRKVENNKFVKSFPVK